MKIELNEWWNKIRIQEPNSFLQKNKIRGLAQNCSLKEELIYISSIMFAAHIFQVIRLANTHPNHLLSLTRGCLFIAERLLKGYATVLLGAMAICEILKVCNAWLKLPATKDELCEAKLKVSTLYIAGVNLGRKILPHQKQVDKTLVSCGYIGLIIAVTASFASLNLELKILQKFANVTSSIGVVILGVALLKYYSETIDRKTNEIGVSIKRFIFSNIITSEVSQEID